MSLIWISLLVLLIFSLSAIFSCRFGNPGSLFYLIDNPNERSLHCHPVSRSGGVAIIFAVIVAMPFWIYALDNIPKVYGWCGLSSLFVAFISYVDDRITLSVKIRLGAQLVIIGLLVTAGDIESRVSLPGIDWKLTNLFAISTALVFLLWMANLYNFMDGMDGFAGGMTVIGFATLGVVGLINNDIVFMSINLLIAAAAEGFLLFNFPPARIFMGDTGSVTLGFLAGCMLLLADHDSIMPIWIGVVIFSPFIFDATVTLLRRILRRERIWQAHRTHFYQRLVQLGWGHRRTVLVEYGLMLICSCAAFLALNANTQTQILIFSSVIAMFTVFFVYVTRLEVRHVKNYS